VDAGGAEQRKYLLVDGRTITTHGITLFGSGGAWRLGGTNVPGGFVQRTGCTVR